MSEQSVQEELLQQVQEQKESLKELSEMLSVDPSEQLQQVLQLCNQPSSVSCPVALCVSYDPACSFMKSCLPDCKRRSWHWLSMSQ